MSPFDDFSLTNLANPSSTRHEKLERSYTTPLAIQCFNVLTNSLLVLSCLIFLLRDGCLGIMTVLISLHHEATVFLETPCFLAVNRLDICPLSTGSSTCFLKAIEFLFVLS